MASGERKKFVNRLAFLAEPYRKCQPRKKSIFFAAKRIHRGVVKLKEVIRLQDRGLRLSIREAPFEFQDDRGAVPHGDGRLAISAL